MTDQKVVNFTILEEKFDAGDQGGDLVKPEDATEDGTVTNDVVYEDDDDKGVLDDACAMLCPNLYVCAAAAAEALPQDGCISPVTCLLFASCLVLRSFDFGCALVTGCVTRQLIALSVALVCVCYCVCAAMFPTVRVVRCRTPHTPRHTSHHCMFMLICFTLLSIPGVLRTMLVHVPTQ